jgi:hypothetical protein
MTVDAAKRWNVPGRSGPKFLAEVLPKSIGCARCCVKAPALLFALSKRSAVMRRQATDSHGDGTCSGRRLAAGRAAISQGATQRPELWCGFMGSKERP